MSILRKLFNRYYFLSVLVLIMLSGQATICRGQQLPDNIPDTALAWINQIRNAEGLKALTMDPRLNKVAETHSKEMVRYKMLTDSNPDLGTPFDRMKSAKLTDTNNLAAVAEAKTWNLLQEQLESPENLSRILSPEMTHAGIGLEKDSTGNIWLTIHMTERAITFTQFILVQSNTTPAEHSITIKGNTPHKKIRVILVPAGDTNPDLEDDYNIAPDSGGNFEALLTFGSATGSFDFEFYVQEDGTYKLKNFFNMNL